MKKILVTVIVLFMPFVVNADTWLDDSSYRDLSWFNEDTYSTTQYYQIDTGEQMAGLLYLVNEENYTFKNKFIRIGGNLSKPFATRNNLVDMSAHEWIPLKSHFDGIMLQYYYKNGSSVSHYFYFETENNDFVFTENKVRDCYKSSFDTCKTIGSYYDSMRYVRVKFNDTIDVGPGGTLANDYSIVYGESTSFIAYPEKNYYVDSVVVKDVNENVLVEKKDIHSITSYYFSVPLERPIGPLRIEVRFSEINPLVCKVINSSGNIIGDEVTCGDERFYIIDSKEDMIKMLAKYNLYTGESIFKEKIEKEPGDTRSDEEYCNDLATVKGGQLKHGSVYDISGYCFVAVPITLDEVKQQKEAVSAHWDNNGNYLYPQIGDVYISGSTGLGSNSIDFFVDESSADKYDGYFYDLQLGSGNISNTLNKYKTKLLFDGVQVEDIDLLTLDEINSIVKTNNKNLPYKEWSASAVQVVPPHYEFAFLNDYLNKNQSFVYNTTYWIRNGYDRNTSSPLGVNSIVFVDSYGGVCGGSITNTQDSVCGQLVSTVNSQIGCGIRPVITISKNDLKYLIKAKTDGNGTIEAIENSLGGETVQFKVSTKNGYKLGSIVITTDSGEKVEFSEGEITKNDDGTLSIDKNKFTMPFENITIQAKFESENILKNPETGDKVLFIMLILVVSIGIGTLIYKKKESRYNI